MVDGGGVFSVCGGDAAGLREGGRGGELSDVDLVAVSGYDLSVVQSLQCLGRSLLFGFDGVLELKDVDVQGLPVLTHVAEYDGSRFIEMWI